MKSKYKSILLLIFLNLFFKLSAQDTLVIGRQDAEAIFLRENLLLMAERLEIEKSEAILLQAKLWPNPSLTLDQVNLWATPTQLKYGDDLPPIFGDFGKNQQLGLEVEQLILTARKRKKLMALEQVTVDKSAQYFEELLRSLKIEFRSSLTRLQYLQFSSRIYINQLQSLRQLLVAYQRQMDQGHVSKGEYIRLKALELELAKNINEIRKEIYSEQMDLKMLMRLPASSFLIIADEAYQPNIDKARNYTMVDLITQAGDNRPDLKIARLEESYFQKMYAYERAQRVPNLNLSGGYDRGGNFMLDFIGFGVSMDVPVFNRNQGNIKYSKLGIDQSKLYVDQTRLLVENEIFVAYQNLIIALDFQNSIEEGYEATLDNLLISYTQNFAQRNISMLEYLDFLDAYLENKQIILDAAREVFEKAEELNYAVGTDLIN